LGNRSFIGPGIEGPTLNQFQESFFLHLYTTDEKTNLPLKIYLYPNTVLIF